MERPLHFSSWTNRQVISWLRGLDDSLEEYLDLFNSKELHGKWLQAVRPQALEQIGLKKVGLQIIIVDFVASLNYQYRMMDTENLQIVVLRVECDASSVITSVERRLKLDKLQETKRLQLKAQDDPSIDIHEDVYPGIQVDIKKATGHVFSAVLKLMTSVEQVVFWLERAPFSTLPELSHMKKVFIEKMLLANKAARLMSSSSQKFKDVMHYAQFIKGRAEEFVQSCKDSLYITPCTLEVVQVKKVDSVDFGITIWTTSSNVHVIDSVKPASPAFTTGRIDEGDEVIQVNEQTVIGWQHRKVIEEMTTSSRKVTLLLRKRPSHYADMPGYPGPRRHKPAHNNPFNTMTPRPVTRPKRRGGLLTDGVRTGDKGEKISSASNTPAGSPMPPGCEAGPGDEGFISSGDGLDKADYTGDGTTCDSPSVDGGDAVSDGLYSEEGTPRVIHRPLPIITGAIIDEDAELSDSDVSITSSRFIDSKTIRSKLLSAVQLQTIVENKVTDEEEDRMSTPGGTLKKENTEDIVRLRKPGINKKSSRRISCKDLGQGDCHGWLYLKKSNALKSKWVKRFCVIKNKFMYYYRNKEDGHAEGLINIHGFTICPEKDVKSGKYAFKAYSEYVDFVFASESEHDRSKWMNKLGLASIGYLPSHDSPGIAGFTPGYTINTTSSPSNSATASPATSERFAAHKTSNKHLPTDSNAPSVTSSASNTPVTRRGKLSIGSNLGGEGETPGYYSESDDDLTTGPGGKTPGSGGTLGRGGDEDEEEEEDKIPWGGGITGERRGGVRLRAAERRLRLEDMTGRSLRAFRRSYTLSMMEQEEKTQNKMVRKVMEVSRLERLIKDKQDQLEKIEKLIARPVTSEALTDFWDNYAYIITVDVGSDLPDTPSES